MAIETNIGHVSQALAFSQRKDLSFILGRNSDWADPTAPDPEKAETASITNPEALVKVQRLVLCYDSGKDAVASASDGDNYVIYKGHQWTTIDSKKVFNGSTLAQDACYVCLIGTLDVGALPMFSYTQIGVTAGAKLAPNAPHQDYAYNDVVTDWGMLYFYENRVKATYTDENKVIIKYMVKF